MPDNVLGAWEIPVNKATLVGQLIFQRGRQINKKHNKKVNYIECDTQWKREKGRGNGDQECWDKKGELEVMV